MTADIFPSVRDGLPRDKNWTVGGGQVIIEASVIFIVSFTVAWPVWFGSGGLADGEKALHWLHLIEIFVLFSLAIEKDLVLFVILP